MDDKDFSERLADKLEERIIIKSQIGVPPRRQKKSICPYCGSEMDCFSCDEVGSFPCGDIPVCSEYPRYYVCDRCDYSSCPGM